MNVADSSRGSIMTMVIGIDWRLGCIVAEGSAWKVCEVTYVTAVDFSWC